MAAPPAQPSFNPITASIVEYLNCPHHRSVIFWLSGILQVCCYSFRTCNGAFSLLFSCKIASLKHSRTNFCRGS